MKVTCVKQTEKLTMQNIYLIFEFQYLKNICTFLKDVNIYKIAFTFRR